MGVLCKTKYDDEFFEFATKSQWSFIYGKYMWNIKWCDTNELIYKIETENELVVAAERMGTKDIWGVWDEEVHTAVFKMGNQQGSTV